MKLYTEYRPIPYETPNSEWVSEVYMHRRDAERMHGGQSPDKFFVLITHPYDSKSLYVFPCRPRNVVAEGRIGVNLRQIYTQGGDRTEVKLFDPVRDGGVPCASIELEFDVLSSMEVLLRDNSWMEIVQPERAQFVDFNRLPERFRNKFDQHYFKHGQVVAGEFEGVELAFTVRSCRTSAVPGIFYQLHDKTEIILVHSGNWKLQDKNSRVILRDRGVLSYGKGEMHIAI